MAKKNKKSKADHIRDFIADYTKNNGEPPTARDVIAGLKKQRVNVTAQAIYQLKSQDRRHPSRAKGRHTRKRARQNQNRQLSVNALKATKKLADQLGGMDRLQEHIDMLQELID